MIGNHINIRANEDKLKRTVFVPCGSGCVWMFILNYVVWPMLRVILVCALDLRMNAISLYQMVREVCQSFSCYCL